jgi:hypothetical protein
MAATWRTAGLERRGQRRGPADPEQRRLVGETGRCGDERQQEERGEDEQPSEGGGEGAKPAAEAAR